MKDYKKILEGVIDIIKTTEKTDIGFANICSYLSDNCDELFKSEDERIRKAIHIYLDWLDGRKDYAPRGEYSIREMIDWLEKQGESHTWTEEDEIGYNDALFAIEKAGLVAKDENDMGNLWYAERWLKSLKGNKK